MVEKVVINLSFKCKSNKNKGFTLIELMIASALLMLVMFSGYYAYSLYSQKWQKRVEVFWQSTEQAVALNSLNRMLTSTAAYIVKDKNKKACVLFEGTQTQLTFITYSAIFSPESAIVQLSVEPFEGSYKLVYKEQEISKSNIVMNLQDKRQWQHEIILIDGLTNFKFSYFGWELFEQASRQANKVEESKVEDTRGWYDVHQANISRILPEKIQLEFTHDNKRTTFYVSLPQYSLYKLIAYFRIDA